MLFPLLGFSINTLSLFGLVLAIGLVVDDAIVVVEAVEHHIEEGLSPRDAALKAMEEVSGPVVGIALILAAVFMPTASSPASPDALPAVRRHHRRLRDHLGLQRADAEPGAAALLLRPHGRRRGPLGVFFGGFNRVFERADRRLRAAVRRAHPQERRSPSWSCAGFAVGSVFFATARADELPARRGPGLHVHPVQLPEASSLQRTAKPRRADRRNPARTRPASKYYHGRRRVQRSQPDPSTYSAFFFVSLKPWSERKDIEQQYPGDQGDS